MYIFEQKLSIPDVTKQTLTATTKAFLQRYPQDCSIVKHINVKTIISQVTVTPKESPTDNQTVIAKSKLIPTEFQQKCLKDRSTQIFMPDHMQGHISIEMPDYWFIVI